MNSSSTGQNSTPPWVTFRQSLNAWYAVQLSLTILGTLLNIILASTIFINGFHRKGAGPLIAQLILIETSMCAFHVPLQTFQAHMAQFHVFSGSSCSYIQFTFLWTQHAGHWSSFFLSVNRFMAILFVQKYTRWHMRSWCKKMMAASWIIGFLLNFPKCLGWGGEYDLMPPWYNCGIRTFGGPYHAIAQAWGVYVPQISLTGLYIIMFIKLEFPWAKIGGNRVQNIVTEDVQMPAIVRRYAIAKMLFVSSLWYIICFFPNPIIGSTTLIRVFIENPVLQLWTRTMYLCGYAVNPVIFFVMSNEYRTGFKTLLNILKSLVQAMF